MSTLFSPLVRKTRSLIDLNNIPPSASSNASSEKPGRVKHDRLFEPSLNMMVNDFDDERTMEEEEAMAAGDDSNDPNAELSSLQREGDMPLSELLKLYGYATTPIERGSDERRDPIDDVLQELIDPHDRMVIIDDDTNTSEAATVVSNDPTQSTDTSSGGNESETPTVQKFLQPSIRDKSMMKQSALCQLYDILPSESEQDAARVLRSVSRNHSDNDVEEEEDDYEYNPDEDDWRKKTIMVGSNYQAIVPEGLSHYDDALPYENDDKLVWDPTILTEIQVETYLREVRTKKKRVSGVHTLPAGKHLKDDEQALFLLQQCGHNVPEALRRRRMSAQATPNPNLWSDDECNHFENGLRLYGKDFYQIHQNKVRTRSVGELVQFYYLWKKTERHDIFANKARLEKKKYTLHPGITDFMDRFLDEQELSNNQPEHGGPTRIFNFGPDKSSTSKYPPSFNMMDEDENTG